MHLIVCAIIQFKACTAPMDLEGVQQSKCCTSLGTKGPLQASICGRNCNCWDV